MERLVASEGSLAGASLSGGLRLAREPLARSCAS